MRGYLKMNGSDRLTLQQARALIDVLYGIRERGSVLHNALMKIESATVRTVQAQRERREVIDAQNAKIRAALDRVEREKRADSPAEKFIGVIERTIG